MAMVDPTLDVTMDLRRPRAGEVDRWVRLVVLLAIAVMFPVLAAGPRVAWGRDGSTLGVPAFWFQNALVIVFMIALVFACIPNARGSRFVRLAVMLPVVQIVLMLGTWLAWQLLKSRMPIATDATPIFDRLPVHVVIPWTMLMIFGGAWLVSRRKRRESLHAAVMLGLVYFLLLGLWLPLACNKWNGEGWRAWQFLEHALKDPNGMIAFVVIPPFVAALAFTFTALRWPQLWRKNSVIVLALLGVALITSIEWRRDVTEIGAFVYVNFIHVLTCAAFVTIVAIATLGAALWIDNARGRRLLSQRDALEGTIVKTEGTIAGLELTSWLRGPDTLCDAFTVSTKYGNVPVPAGARVVAATPLATTLLRGGESVQTLRYGDRVRLAGYVQADASSPFRTTLAPIPGANGITVGRVADEHYGFSHVALDLWRPSIAYLLICVAIALPGLAALLSDRF